MFFYVFLSVRVCMCECFYYANHQISVVTDSGKSQHRIRLNYRGEKGAREARGEEGRGGREEERERG